MDADLGKSTMTGEFAKKFPDRYFELGIAEHNLIGTAAGLALGGKIPFAASFACFLAGRFETIRMSVASINANVKLVGTHAGIGIGEDGNSQMGLEDVSLMRSLPNMAVIQPADDLETRQAIEWAANNRGPVYFRLTRQKVPDVHKENYKFQFGKGDVLLEANTEKEKKIAILATGGVVYNALQAASELAKAGTGVIMVNIHTIKPLDEELVRSLAQKFGKIVTVEDHNIIGGLGSAVCEAAAETESASKVLRIGIKGYGESGKPEELYEKYGLSIQGISKSIKDFLSK